MSNNLETSASKEQTNTENRSTIDIEQPNQSEQSFREENNESTSLKSNAKHNHTGHGGSNHQHHKGCNHNHGHEEDSHGHSHSHDHDNHGLSKAHKRNMIFQRNAFYIRLFTMGMPSQAVIIDLFWLTDAIADRPFDYWVNIIALTFIYLMCWVSYGYATYAAPFTPARYVPNFADPRFASTCKTCGIWKPERAHHCSTCGKCVARMDHHCPWIVNCVGYKNHKSFLLFCLYMGLGASIYCWRSVYYLYWSYNNERLFDHSWLFLIWWALVTIIITPVFMMLGGLGFYHSLLASNNATTLDTMQRTSLKSPCVPDRFYNPLRFGINVYDKGILANLWDFFDKSYCFWWFPNTKPVTDEGLFFTSNPQPKKSMAITPPHMANTPINPTQAEGPKPTSLSTFNYEEFFQRAEVYVTKKHLAFNGKVFEYEKIQGNAVL